MYHMFFIHACVNGYLGCFLVLAFVNSAAVNIELNVSFQTMFFLGICPEVLCRWCSGKEYACQCRDAGWEDPLEKEMETHSIILA